MDKAKKATTYQLTTSKTVLFPGHNHLLITVADEPLLQLSLERQWLFCAVVDLHLARKVLLKSLLLVVYQCKGHFISARHSD